MNSDEQRLSQLLKGTVPHPPYALTADQVTTRRVDRTAKSWAIPAMAAATVAVIGVTAGVLASNHGSEGAPSPASPGGAPAASASKSAVTVSGSASPHATPSCSAQVVTVPSLIGMTQSAAIATAAQAGLAARVTAVTSDVVPRGLVISQSPAPGTKVQPGAVLAIKVAAAPGAGTGAGTASGQNAATQQAAAAACPSASQSPPAQGGKAARVAVPNVTGMSAAAATAILQAAGFTVTVVVAHAPAGQTVAPGTVYEQTPAAGTMAAHGTQITLFVEPSA